MNRILRGTLIVFAPLLACSDPLAGETCGQDVFAIGQAIINGAQQEQFLGLAAQEIAAIVLIDNGDWPVGSACTGVLVRPNFVLTAGHCLVIESPLVHLGTTGGHADTARVTRTIIHPELDIALLEIEPAASLQGLAISAESPDDRWLGRRVELAGYGLTESGQPRGLRFAVEPIVDVTANKLRVDGGGRSGACEGDSGGPLLSRGSDGRVLVSGILSTGQASCVGTDGFTRTDRVADWLDSNLPASQTSDDIPCGQITASGRCSSDMALRCVAGQLLAESCDSEQVCGWDVQASHFGCVAAAVDPCQGAGSLGLCDGDRALTCLGGKLVSRDCAACGACVYSTSSGAPQCASIEQ